MWWIDMNSITRRDLGRIGATALTLSIAGCSEDAADDEPSEDEEMSRAEAVEYVDNWVMENVGEENEEALDHFEAGRDEYVDESYSRAIYELENATEIFEEIKGDTWDKRGEFDEGQPRRELFDLAWNMLRLMHEAAASWYNAAYAIQVKDDPAEAAEMRSRGEEHYEKSQRASAEYHNTMDEWEEE